MGELPCRVLAEQDRASRLQLCGTGAVLDRNVVRKQPRLRRRAHARDVEDVLQTVWDAVQRPARARGHDFGFRLSCVAACTFGGDGDEAVELVVERRDAREIGFSQLNGRQPSRRDQLGGFGDRQEVQVGCHRFSSSSRTLRDRRCAPVRHRTRGAAEGAPPIGGRDRTPPPAQPRKRRANEGRRASLWTGCRHGQVAAHPSCLASIEFDCLAHDLIRKPVSIPDRGRGHVFRCHARAFARRKCSSSRGMISTKLQGR